MNQAKQPKTITIVGGGTAGWMSASLLKKSWPQAVICLVESSNIPTIGVGEGSTPAMKDFFKTLEIPESEWMPACEATYKSGISFPNWSTIKGYESYFHAFYSAFDLKTGQAFFNNADLRRRGAAAEAHPDNFWLAAELARRKKSPIHSKPLPFEVDYAYHFDAGLLGEFLKRKSIEAGVSHLVDDILDVNIDPSTGAITSLVSQNNESIQSDFYIDCTGFRSRLMQKSLGVGFTSFSDHLFNDAAVAISTPAKTNDPLPVETVSSALSSGWAWSIPLRNRFGNGYVYSSNHISADQAETELRRKLGLLDSDVEARHLKMRVGRTNSHWHKNCLAIGLSQGFIEPLEATALMLVQFGVQEFIRQYSKDNKTTAQSDYNDTINESFAAIRDYVQSHYHLNSRSDSNYWIENRNNKNISQQLQDIITTWKQGGDINKVLNRYSAAVAYLKPSWYTILAGMGQFPEITTVTSGTAAPAHKAKIYCEEMAKGFPDHRRYLASII